MIQLCSRCKKRPAVVFISDMSGKGDSAPQGLCLVCAKESGIKPVNDMLEKMNISDEDIEQMSEQLMEVMDMAEDEDGEFSPGGAQVFPFLNNLFSQMPGEQSKAESTAQGDDSSAKEKKKPKQKRRKFIDQYCTNLTEKAKNGQLDRIIGRDDELYRVIQILSRRSKNNPCLIGEPGVGKTAIAEGLAIRIASGQAPARLLDKEIHLLDMTGLVAGTQFRGQFESRVKGLIDEVKSEGNIILFIDEVHNLVGAGDAEGSMNAGNILKPALSRGELQVIGATTFKEYRKYIEKDPALERRFQPVTVEEPSQEETVKVLTGVKGYYEGYHGVTIPDFIVESCVKLSERYIHDRFLPDKAIDLLDESCSCASLRNTSVDELYVVNKKIAELSAKEEQLEAQTDAPDYEALANVKSQLAQNRKKAEALYGPASNNTVTEDDVAKVIELWTGIPAVKIKQSNLQRLANLEDRMKERIIGQDEAVAAVAAGVRRSGVQISTHRRPASFIFVGPTGVGKTELVKVLSEQLFNTPETLIRLDMSEFMEKHSVSRLIGAPPGYVGYDEAGQLTEKVRRKPYSVILLDEIEKAHPDVLNIMLQILDDGRVTDAQGRTVNFENTVIVMTSNAGSERKEALLGFGKSTNDVSREKSLQGLREFLRPEFLARVDDIVVFSELKEEDYTKIAGLILGELVPVLAEKGITFTWEPAVCNYFAGQAVQNNRGARDLRRQIRKEVEDKVVDLLIEQKDTPPTAISAELKNGSVKISAK